MLIPNTSDLLAVLPEIILCFAGGLILLGGAFIPAVRKYASELTLLSVVLAGWARLSGPLPGMCFGDMLSIDILTIFVDVFFLAAVFLAAWIAGPYLRKTGTDGPEFYALLMLAGAGAMVMASAVDALTLFLGLELLSIPLYVLNAYLKHAAISVEAGLKYFVVGAFASAFVVYGIALLYGATGSLNLVAMGESVRHGHAVLPLLGLGIAALVGGFGFKLALVPFHGWAPDVYQGGPTPVTAFLSVVPKGAVLVALLRIVDGMELLRISGRWLVAGAILAIASQTLGNLVAIVQRDIKRMLAYSGIAHMGYAMVGIIVAGIDGSTGVLVYIGAYTLMNLGAFAIVAYFANSEDEAHLISDYQGQGWKRPVPALALMICMFSLAGIPPFVGFIGKFMIFSSAVNAGMVWLAVVGVINSLISAFYYLRVVYTLYMKPEPRIEVEFTPSFSIGAAAAISAVAVTVLGIYPTPLLAAAKLAALTLMP